MHAHATPVLDRPASTITATSPLIGAPVWFEPGPFVVRLEVGLSFAEMVAALYDLFNVPREELATAEDVWGHIAGQITSPGLSVICIRAVEIVQEEADGGLEDPAWLEFCRDRVSALVSGRLSA